MLEIFKVHTSGAASLDLFGKSLSVNVFDGVLFCTVLLPTRFLGRDLRLNLVSYWHFSYLLLESPLHTLEIVQLRDHSYLI